MIFEKISFQLTHQLIHPQKRITIALVKAAHFNISKLWQGRDDN
jgi:hypothetical protein